MVDEASADIGVIGGSGLYALLDDAERSRGRHAVRPAERPVHRRPTSVAGGGLPAPARPGPPLPAAPDPLPGQPVGAARARRAPGPRAVRGRRAAAGARAGHVRGARPAGRPHERAGADVLRRPARCTCPSPTRTARPGARAALAAARGAGSSRSTAARWSSSRGRASPPARSRGGTPRMGWSVVNMTGHPEAVLARELALCYTSIALVTDLDAGVERRRRGHPGRGVRGLRAEHRAAARRSARRGRGAAGLDRLSRASTRWTASTASRAALTNPMALGAPSSHH